MIPYICRGGSQGGGGNKEFNGRALHWAGLPRWRSLRCLFIFAFGPPLARAVVHNLLPDRPILYALILADGRLRFDIFQSQASIQEKNLGSFHPIILRPDMIDPSLCAIGTSFGGKYVICSWTVASYLSYSIPVPLLDYKHTYIHYTSYLQTHSSLL
ncbi:hypothetical protein F4859DRAFT_102670 [Xylaria cf. heliscus]|nr:hypothetical protein F4859DRAFT_102670 [Xylaria cf. heliscus]